jgi:hypothetical protein
MGKGNFSDEPVPTRNTGVPPKNEAVSRWPHYF